MDTKEINKELEHQAIKIAKAICDEAGGLYDKILWLECGALAGLKINDAKLKEAEKRIKELEKSLREMLEWSMYVKIEVKNKAKRILTKQ